MHSGNRHWWYLCKESCPEAFVGKRVLDVGSYDINGSIRDYFEACDYTGVDFRPGPKVDVVCLAHEMDFQEKFDVVVSGQMLEHDPYWDRSINKMIDLLKPTGMLYLSWGSAIWSSPHELGEWAPDGGFHPLAARQVVELVHSRGLEVKVACYETELPGAQRRGENYYVVAARMPQAPPIEMSLTTPFAPADDVPWLPS